VAKQSLKDQILNSISTDQLSRKKDGTFVAYRTYFYTGGVTSSAYAGKIMQQLASAGFTAELIGHGDHFAAFKGGASVKQSSHWWVNFRINAASAENKQVPVAATVGQV